MVTRIRRMQRAALFAAVSMGASISASMSAYAQNETDTDDARLPGWELVWSDEFDGDMIDPEKWSFDVDCWGGGNDERQCYTDRAENAGVRDGNLEIIARQEWMRGSALPFHLRNTPEDAAKTEVKPFSSAKLTTRGKADWTYGRFEIRARLPEGQGTWPAIWMLPADEAYGPWAASGEIDIMEAVNLGEPCRSCPGKVEDRVLGTIHFGGPWPENTYKSEETHMAATADGFHVFAVEWREGEIVWFVDGEEYGKRTSRSWRSTTKEGRASKNAPFDKAFYMILNLAIGGNLAESRNEEGVSLEGYPKTMLVDYVRVYKPAPRAE